MHGVDKVQTRVEIDMAHKCLIKTSFFVWEQCLCTCCLALLCVEQVLMSSDTL